MIPGIWSFWLPVWLIGAAILLAAFASFDPPSNRSPDEE